MQDLNSAINEAMSRHNVGVQELTNKPLTHFQMLHVLLEGIAEIDWHAEANLEHGEKLSDRHVHVITVEQVLKRAHENNWSLCIHNEFLYSYNGQYWEQIDRSVIQALLGCAAEKLGIGKYIARHHQFQKSLVKQFMSAAVLPRPEERGETVLINLQNGTFEITPNGSRLREFDRNDFLTYQLPFVYDPVADAPMFKKFLERVQPDENSRKVLSEFLGGVFIKTRNLKLEKALLLYGDGANGKSVFYDLMNALLGPNNVSSYSLASLMDTTGYYRANLANKLLNYASEITGELETGMFKQLTSGEPVPARIIYCAPVTVRDYAKLAFNCNALPKNVEHTNAYFRRFLIVPFKVTIPEAEQDRQLAPKIVAAGELSGIFNWVLEGLNRLLLQKGFTYSDEVSNELAKYQAESDNVRLFLEERDYVEDLERYIAVKFLSDEYAEFCRTCRYKPLNHGNFVKRLRGLGVLIEKRNIGLVAFVQRAENLPAPQGVTGTPRTPQTPHSFFSDHE